MPLQLAIPVQFEEILKVADKKYEVLDTEPTIISVRKASTGDIDRVRSLTSTLTSNLGENGFNITKRLDFSELRRLQVYLTLAACNIPSIDGKTNLFKFSGSRISMSEREFEAAWAQLPPEYSEEIYEYVLNHNPIWTEQGEE